MIPRRLSMITVVTLAILVSQFIPFGDSQNVAAASLCNSARFVADVTIPDGTAFQPGVSFVKTWRLKNTGTCTWTSAYSLIFVSGDSLGAAPSASMPTVAPGKQADVSVNMKAPATPGHYRGYWMLKDAQGNKFGLGANADGRFWVDINVSGPTTPTSTSIPNTHGTILDFTKEMCSAKWISGAGTLPCPSTDGDTRGFALNVDHPKLENGITDSAPGILVSPQSKTDGYIQGIYPEMTVQSGDRFLTSVGCAYGSSCYVTYRLDYEIDNNGPKILWSWSEKNEGMTYQLNKDLSALAGKKVKFTLTLLASGPATGDRAIWGQPRIVRSNGSIPTSTPITSTPTSITPTGTVPTPSPSTGSIFDFAVNACSASWKSEAGTLPCPGTDGDSRGFVLQVNNPKLENGSTDNASALILFPQNKNDGYIQGTYPEITVQAGDRFQGIVNCAYGVSCYVTFRLDYQIGSGAVTTFWSWKEKNEGQYYKVDKDLSVLAGKKVKFILTILAAGPATNDRALWSQPRFIHSGSTLLPIYDFNTFNVIGSLKCTEVANYTWRQNACNGESGGCWISQTPIFGNSYAGFFRHEGNSICGLNIP